MVDRLMASGEGLADTVIGTILICNDRGGRVYVRADETLQGLPVRMGNDLRLRLPAALDGNDHRRLRGAATALVGLTVSRPGLATYVSLSAVR
jgi:hypothetical protein